MPMPGRFARRVTAWGAANGVLVVFCKAGERRHRVAEEYLAARRVSEPGVFSSWSRKPRPPGGR